MPHQKDSVIFAKAMQTLIIDLNFTLLQNGAI